MEGTTMASTIADSATETVVKAAEDIVASAAKSETKGRVPSATAETGEARAWDAKAQID